MTKINCLNPIAACGLDMLTDNYELIDNAAEAEAILVRSAVMHDMESHRRYNIRYGGGARGV